MYLLVHLVGAVTTDQVSHVIQRPVLLQQRHATGDDIDIVTDGEVHESLTDLLGVLGQPTDALRLA